MRPKEDNTTPNESSGFRKHTGILKKTAAAAVGLSGLGAIVTGNLDRNTQQAIADSEPSRTYLVAQGATQNTAGALEYSPLHSETGIVVTKKGLENITADLGGGPNIPQAFKTLSDAAIPNLEDAIQATTKEEDKKEAEKVLVELKAVESSIDQKRQDTGILQGGQEAAQAFAPEHEKLVKDANELKTLQEATVPENLKQAESLYHKGFIASKFAFATALLVLISTFVGNLIGRKKR